MNKATSVVTMKKNFLTVAIAALTLNIQPVFADYFTEAEGNDAFGLAESVDAYFSRDLDGDIFKSTEVYHASVQGAIDTSGDVDYYSFAVTMPGIEGFFDIDGAEGATSSSNLDTVLALFDASFNLLAFSTDTPEDPGSICTGGNGDNCDSFIGSYIFPSAGTYYVAVSSLGSVPTAYGSSIAALIRPDGANGGNAYSGSGPSSLTTTGTYPSGSYILHISVPEPASLSLLGAGLAGLGWRHRKRMK